MLFRYDIEKVKHILDDLSVLTGIKLSFLDSEFHLLYTCVKDFDYCSTLQENGNIREKCTSCDRKILEKCWKTHEFEHHFCHAGLFDACFPITKNGCVAGIVLFGRIRTATSPRKSLYRYKSQLDELYNELPFFSDKKIESLKQLLPNILFENVITVEYEDILVEITNYLNANLKNKVSINSICSTFHISKDSLYHLFDKYYNCTVNEYILNKKIEKAKTFLKETSIPIYQIAENAGIENYTYFCRLFKDRVGITAKAYRKENAVK